MTSRGFPYLQSAMFVCLCLRAHAATIYSGLQDIAVPTNFAGIYLDIDTGATSTSAFSGWDINPFFGGAGIGNSAAFQPARVGASNLDAILKLGAGTLVSGSLTFSSGIGGSGNAGREHLGGNVATQFQPGTEGYIGFKFTKNDSSGPLFGWMRVVLTNNTSGALIKDWGYDNVSGNSIVAGRVQQSAASAGTQTYTISPGTGESFSLGSAITNTGGNINSLLKTGAGTTTLDSSNSFTGSTTISGGALVAATAGALGSTSSIAVNTGGTLLLGGSGDRIGDATGLSLAGGTLGTAGLSETLGVLALSATSIIDLGYGASALTFASSTAADWGSNRLRIYNWTGFGSGGGADGLFFLGGGLTSAQLSQIDFYSDGGSTFLGHGGFAGLNEVVPIPEPSAAFMALALIALSGRRECRRRRLNPSARLAASGAPSGSHGCDGWRYRSSRGRIDQQ